METILILSMVVSLILYFSGQALVRFLFRQLKSYFLSKRRYRAPRKQEQEQITWQQKRSKEYKYAFRKDFPLRLLNQIIYLLSILLTLLMGYFGFWLGILASLLFPLMVQLLFYFNTKSFIQDEETTLERMLQFKRSKMGLIDNKSSLQDYAKEFEILEWDKKEAEKDPKRPKKIRLYIPVTFDPIGKERFLEDFSIQFGGTRPYEVDITDEEAPGWNSERGVATILLQKPLPNVAMWKDYEWLIDHPSISPMFMPLGVGSKGGITLTNPHTGLEENIIGYDLDGSQTKLCQKLGMRTLDDIVASPMSLGAGVTGGGKSVCQNNMINWCLTHPNRIQLFGIDMKKVELGKLRKYGVNVGTTYADAAVIAEFVQMVMMSRYEQMEALGINDWNKMPDGERGPAIFLMIDEASELLSPVSGKSDEAKEIQSYQEVCQSSLESIARLGRAAQVHLTIWSQRPSSELISMQIRQNCTTRLAAGTVPATISGMVFESNFGARVPGNPKGRMSIKTHGFGPMMFQGFFAPTGDMTEQGWIDEYLEKHNLPQVVYGEDSDLADYKQSKHEGLDQELAEAMTAEEIAQFTNL